METLFVTKHDGQRQSYDNQKVLASIISSGVDKNRVMDVLGHVEKKVYNGISTKELYRLVYEEIDEAGFDKNARLYRLREALAKMGSIDFEKFVDKILAKEGFKTKWNTIVPGFCVEHQLDIIAQMGKNIFFVEVKRHQNPHRDSGLGYVAELWARFVDLQEGFKVGRHNWNFSNAWLFTNTKFSDHAKQYSACKGLRLTGWRYTFEGGRTSHCDEGLEKMLELIGLDQIDSMIKNTVNY